MDIKDFQNSSQFKKIIPALYIISWIVMFAGPHFFPVIYMNLHYILMIYLLYKVVWVPTTMLIVFIEAWKNMNQLKNAEQGKSYQSLLGRPDEEIIHAFIIPNYKQQIELIEQTLDVLSAHKRAKGSYLVFLAMEAHEQGSDKKAQILLKKYKNNFLVIDYSHHKIRQYQQKGKASNVSWCAQNLQPIFQKNSINPDSVMLTIIDVDSWAPDLYFDVLEKKINEQYEQRHTRIYQPMQIFTRNNLDVPVVTRVYDIIHSTAHMMNLYSCFNLTFSLSNYTLSYNLVKRIGFWDTVPQAIGEDFHMVMKCFFKTHYQVKPTPIYVPFNQVNISTGNGYWADCKARFWQAERHAKGVADVAYCFLNFLKQPCNKMSFMIFWFVFQAFCIGAVVPWFMIGSFYCSNILYRGVDMDLIYSRQTLGYMITFMSTCSIIAYLLYEILKRRANKLIYKQQNQSIGRVFQYILLSFPLFIIIGIPTFCIAAFKTVLGKSDYVVAEKKISKQLLSGTTN